MKKKYLIYLLTFLMAFSPAAVFADAVEGGTPSNDPIVEEDLDAPEDVQDQEVPALEQDLRFSVSHTLR